MDWSMVDEWSSRPYDAYYPYYDEKNIQPMPAQHVPTQAQPYPASQAFTLLLSPTNTVQPPPPPTDMAAKGDSPREIRNKAEKQRRDKMNQSIAQLAAIVPPVVATGRKMDKTSVLKLTAHYLRAHQYVFGDSINSAQQFSATSARALLGLLKGFILTTTYKGIVVVVSQNVQQYLGYTELDLIGQSIFKITHKDDHRMLREQLMPKSYLLGSNGELLIPDEPDAKQKVADALAREKRRFIVRFKKLGQRSEPSQYVTCHLEGTLRKSDRACRNNNRCCQLVRRVRARGDNPCSSGNDVVFIGLVRPTSETFINDNSLESFRMEYRTRHSIDGEIIECESRIALVTGYMTHEVNGVNAMNFMHRDDVRWVIIALREMYDQHRLVGESCYRLMTKSGKFIYMQTKGFLDVDQDSRAVTSFVCTNTVVEEHVGKHLIKLMKKRFTLLINNTEEPAPDDEDESREVNDNQILPVEDPRQLEKVILHLVTNLPSPQPESPQLASTAADDHSHLRLAIIPPRKERIVSAIEKIYSVIKTMSKRPKPNMESNKSNQQHIDDYANFSDEYEPEGAPSYFRSLSSSHSAPRNITFNNNSSQRLDHNFRNRNMFAGQIMENVSASFPQVGRSELADSFFLNRFNVPQIDDGQNSYTRESHNFGDYITNEGEASFTTTTTYVGSYTTSTVTSSTSVISESRNNTTPTPGSFGNKPGKNMPPNSTSRPSTANRRIVRAFLSPRAGSRKSQEPYNLHNNARKNESPFPDYEAPRVNYTSTIGGPSTSYPSAVANTSPSNFSIDINGPNYNIINPTLIPMTSSSYGRHDTPYSLFEIPQPSCHRHIETYNTDGTHNNNTSVTGSGDCDIMDYSNESSMEIPPTAISPYVLPQTEQVTFEIIGFTDNNPEQINLSAPESHEVPEPESRTICGIKRPNESSDCDEMPSKKVADDVPQDSEEKEDNDIPVVPAITPSLLEQSILCSQYLPQCVGGDEIDVSFDLRVLEECESIDKEDGEEELLEVIDEIKTIDIDGDVEELDVGQEKMEETTEETKEEKIE